MIPIFKPAVAEPSIERVTQTLCAGWLSEGKQVSIPLRDSLTGEEAAKVLASVKGGW
jgi:hypothetical protein